LSFKLIILGIIEKIPYLKYLGVCAVWFTPIYPSPGVDMGYDVTDYRGIDENIGTMEDFEELKNKLHENGLYNFNLYYSIKQKIMFTNKFEFYRN